MYNFMVSILPPDGLTLPGARPFAGAGMVKVKSYMYTGPAL